MKHPLLQHEIDREAKMRGEIVSLRSALERLVEASRDLLLRLHRAHGNALSSQDYHETGKVEAALLAARAALEGKV